MDIENEKRISLAFMSVIYELSPAIYDAVDNIFKKFGVGGGIFWSRSLSGDVAKKTRYEIISYLTALETILLDQWPSRTEEPWGITELLEHHIFSMQLGDARPAYDVYRELFNKKHHQESNLYPREHFVHSLFTQRIIDLWMKETGWVPQSSEVIDSFSSELITLVNAAEGTLRAGLSGIWPEKSDQ